MHSKVSRFSIFFFFLSLSAIYFACTKITDTNIGSGLIPPVDGVITKDTVLDIITKNKSLDTVSVGFSDDHVLGYVHDPVFGKTTASINFQVSPPTSPFSFPVSNTGDSLHFDSVVLSLHYTGVWGDSTSHLLLHVYQMDPENKFTVDSSYNNTISFEPGIELTNGAKDINIQTLNDPDTLQAFNEDVTNQVRIPLNAAFGEKFFNEFINYNAYQNDSTFNTYFKGFIVEAEQQTVSNALIKISLSDTSTRLSLYYKYRNPSTGVYDTSVARFSPKALSSASSNTITRNYQGADIANFYPPKPTVNDSLIYIQTSPGTYATLNIPGLSKLPNMVVHRAEILMQQVPGDQVNDNYFTSPNLFVSAYSTDSMRRFAVPYDVTFSGGTISNLTSFGVLPISKTDKNTGQKISTYSFDISRYVQGIVARKDTIYNLVLWAPYNSYISNVEQTIYTYPISTPALNTVAIGRVRLGGGGNNSQYKMRLHIVYSLP